MKEVALRKLTNDEIVARQQQKIIQPRILFTVVLNNIRSLYNVGSIFRTADGVGVEKILLCGITGFPPQSQISKTALGAESRVPWAHADDVLQTIRDLQQRGYQIVLLEQMDKSVEYQRFSPRFPLCLVVGNEIEGISDELISLCDAAVEIPMAGIKNSLNVGTAFGVVAYHFRNCFAA